MSPAGYGAHVAPANNTQKSAEADARYCWFTDSNVAGPSFGAFTQGRGDGYFDGYTLINGKRALDPNTHNWYSRDSASGNTADPISSLPYAYANNNPSRYDDPTGEFALSLWLEVGSIVARMAGDPSLSRDLGYAADIVGIGEDLGVGKSWATKYKINDEGEGEASGVSGATQNSISRDEYNSELPARISPSSGYGAISADDDGLVVKPVSVQNAYPGNDPKVSPGAGFTWRGGSGSIPGDARGAWYNAAIDTSLHPDLNHGPPIGPHWDLTNPFGAFRIFPDGSIKLK
jgi:hypothetical protein